MNIALVVHDLHQRGGHSRYARVLADGLARCHAVTVFANYCERSPDSPWKFVPVRAWRATALTTVRSFPIGMHSLNSKLAEFDIRHTQGYCGGRPNVVTAHICLAAYVNSLRDISMRSRTSLGLMAAAEKRFYRRYEGHVIAISQKVGRELQELYEMRGPISVIPHGVDAGRFRGKGEDSGAAVRRELGIEKDSTLALYVGDLTKSHTHLKALSAAAPEVAFVIVTSSKQYHWTGRNVHIVPASTTLERYYAAADAFLFPTTYDAFGMVLLEAMASGVPVFTSDRAGAAELISSGTDGFVFSLDDWTEATLERLHDRDSLRRVGAAGELTSRRHDWPTVVAAVEQVYSSVAAAGEPVSYANGAKRKGYHYQQ